MDKVTNVLIVGVGGQGVLLASEVLSEVAMQVGLDVKKSEVHGMSQRGGVVSSHIKFGSKVHSPIIPYGQADILISFEKAEALRALHWVRKNGLVATSNTRLVPPGTATGKFAYPEDPVGEIKKKFKNVISLDADKIALELGNPRLVNILLLGVVSTRLEFETPAWEEAIKSRVKPKFVDLNLKAFARGRELAEEAIQSAV
ncbi:MAG TPA: indolepyruvate oxidoreductase subunit beta [candidate division Zixibacteria bacterium]|nr:indolepyruvate oxidoreductase subunit beta [candidate division Zixibacteria bacterium]